MLLRSIAAPIRNLLKPLLSRKAYTYLSRPKKGPLPTRIKSPHFRVRFFSSQVASDQSAQIPEEVVKILQTITSVFSQLYNLGRYQQASNVNQEYALQLEMMEFPKDHPAYLTYLNNKALLLKNDGKYEQALQIYEDVLLKYREFYQASTPSIAVVLSNLGTLKQLVGRPQDALADVEEAITIKTNTKADEVNLALSVAQKASILKDLKQFQQAYKLLRGALEVTAMVKGENSLESVSIISDMAMLHKAQGKYEKAEGDFERVIKQREEILGAQHPNTLAAKHNLAELYRVWGKLDEAQSLFEKIAQAIKQREEEDQKIMRELKEQQQDPRFDKVNQEAKKYEEVRTEYLSKRGKRPKKPSKR